MMMRRRLTKTLTTNLIVEFLLIEISQIRRLMVIMMMMSVLVTM